jgi:hypothetical protein
MYITITRYCKASKNSTGGHIKSLPAGSYFIKKNIKDMIIKGNIKYTKMSLDIFFVKKSPNPIYKGI